MRLQLLRDIFGRDNRFSFQRTSPRNTEDAMVGFITLASTPVNII